jgi:DNA polymerase III delta subunit
VGRRRVTEPLFLAYGDDGLGLDLALREFAAAIEAVDRVEIVPDRTPDEAAIDRAGVEAGTASMFGAHLTVLRQPLRAAGRSAGAAERLMGLVTNLPPGCALALVEERSSRDAGKAPALLLRLAEAVRARGGTVAELAAPRKGELRGWIVRHAARLGIRIETRAAHVLAERVGGAIWETDVERGEQTRMADAELRKLATYAGDREIATADVEALTADTRPASVFAVTNAVDRREPGAAADALRRALDDGQPGLRILASLAGRVSDLIAARDLAARRAPPAEIAKRVARGNVRAAERLVEAAKRYRGDELDAMLIGLFEADVAIKTNVMDEEPALVAWLGEHLLAGGTQEPAKR